MTNKNILIAAGAVVVLAASFMAGRDLLLFFNPVGLFLVVGGTLAAAFLAFPSETIREVKEQIQAMNAPQKPSVDEIVELFADMARTLRKDGPRAMEEKAKLTGNQFLEMGVAMAADERPPEVIRERLEQEMDFFLSRRDSQRAVLSFMGRLAPAFGLAGTMVGLIRMLHSLKDPASVAEGMSVALLTTFYGLMLANLVILPVERKLRERHRAEAVILTLIVEGVMGLALQENGVAITARLKSFRFAQAQPAAPAVPGAHGWLKSLNPMGLLTRSTVDDR